MSKSYTTANQSVGQSINNFVATVTSALEKTEAPTDAIDAIEEQGEEIDTVVDDTINEQAERLEKLEEETSNDIEHTGKRLAELNGRVSDVEETLDGGSSDDTPTPNTSQTTPQTPLEEICRLPQHVADDSLTSNQERARFVAKDIEQYGRAVPAGRAITSSDLRRVISAKEEGRTHTQTVSRVMDFLEELGKDDVSIKETMGGQRTVVFTDEVVERLNQLTNHGVVMDDDRHGVIQDGI